MQEFRVHALSLASAGPGPEETKFTSWNAKGPSPSALAVTCGVAVPSEYV
jgi:hypothetical protein